MIKPATNRDLQRVTLRHAARIAIVLLISFACGVSIYFNLGSFQHIFRPPAPPDGFVIDPPPVFRTFLAFYGPAFLATPTISKISRRWRQQDAAKGIQVVTPPTLGLISRIISFGILAFFAALLLFALAAFFFGYTVIASDSISTFRFFGPSDFAYSQVQTLTVIPENHWAGSQTGPHATVTFTNRSVMHYGHDNGVSNAEFQAITKALSEKSGIPASIDYRAVRIK